MKNRKGFTLVELLVVIVILGIVTGLSIPLIRNIQANNEKKEFKTYMETLKYSSKLYVDSYGEDLFGRHKSGCVVIKYKDLYDKGLIKDIPVDEISCATDDTFVRVVKLDGKFGYGVAIGCGSIKNNTVSIDTSMSNTGIIDNASCDYDATMDFNAIPESNIRNNYKKQNIKVRITSATGINNNAKIYYGFSYGRDTNVINNDWKKLNIKISGKQKQKEDIYSGKIISIESGELVTPVGVTGDLYLVLRIDKLENLAEEPLAINNEDNNIKYFGQYRVDNTKPQFNDSTIISSENGFNSLRPKLNLEATDNFSTTNELSMCISYGSDTCSLKVSDMKNKTSVDNYTNNTRYETYNASKVLSEITNTYNSSTHTIFVTIADAAGNYEKQTFQYRVARRWTLTYDSNGGSACSPASKSHTFNDWETSMTWGTLCQPTRTNFEFLGWKTESGTTITSTSQATSDLTAIGDWKALFAFSFRYSGSFSYKDGSAGWVNANNTTINILSTNWQVKFLSSGTLTVLGSLSNIDVFLVGGGGGAGGCSSTRGGGGGGGGYTTTQTNIAINNTDYPVTIGGGGGCGASGGTSTALGYSAAGGGAGRAYSNGRGGDGGSGGGGNFGGNGFPSPTGTGGSNGSNGSDGRVRTYQSNGNINEYNYGGSGCASNGRCKINGRTCTNTRAFCESDGELFAGGGAGGDHEYCGVGGSGGGAGSGQGGWCVCGCPGRAQANKGGGGAMSGGSSGIVIIRNTR